MIGIIGGSGFDNPDIWDGKIIQENSWNRYGQTSDGTIITGKINGIKVAFIARQGKKHTVAPHEVNYQASIFALHALGCTRIIATTMVGSFWSFNEIGMLVMPSQLIDFTKNRKNTYFDYNQVCHISMAKPFCETMRNIMEQTAKELEFRYRSDRNLAVVEGPRFGSAAEAEMFKKIGADIVNMTTMPEATLARELGMHYQVIGVVTDYDCIESHSGNDHVNTDEVYKQASIGANKIIDVIKAALPEIDKVNFKCRCEKEIDKAVV